MSRLLLFMMLGLSLALAAPGMLTAQDEPAAAAEPMDPAREKAVVALEQKLGFRSIDPFTGRAETEAERIERLGTDEDPGADPDPEKVFTRFGQAMTIQKFPKTGAATDQKPGWVRPLAYINIAREIYREDDEHFWVWLYQPGAAHGQTPAPAASESKYRVPKQPEIDVLEAMRADFTPLDVPAANKTIRFVESSAGLPTTGSWRNSLAVADMNKDGHLDLLVPPQRGADDSPRIYLGDGKGGWSLWEEASFDWPIDYGSAAVGDLNGDGHLDVVFAIHLRNLRVFLNDGKGNFTSENVTGLPENFPTRKAVLHDLDGDGDLDIVAISEGPTMAMGRAEDLEPPPARLQAFLNEKGTNWRQVLIGDGRSQVGGDWLAVANLNGDRYPDLVASSIYFHGPEVLWMGKKDVGFDSIGMGMMPYFSFYFAVEAGKFSSRKQDDAIFSFARAWPREVDPEVVRPVENLRMVGLERVSWVKGKPVGTPIVRWPTFRTVFSLGKGDFDNDGKLDLIYATYDPRAASILLGDGKGGFRRADLEGLELPDNSNYSISVADVDGDGRQDVIMMFEALKGSDGSIRVWLNRSE
jgi:hypothetical protein